MKEYSYADNKATHTCMSAEYEACILPKITGYLQDICRFGCRALQGRCTQWGGEGGMRDEGVMKAYC